jgi:hypothetical protein
LEMHGGELAEVELEIERRRRRYREEIMDAATDELGRKVLIYPVALDRVGVKATALKRMPVKSDEDRTMWYLLTKEAELLRKHTSYLEDIEQK